MVCDDLDRTRTWLVGVDDSLGVTLPRALIRCRQNAQRKRDALFVGRARGEIDQINAHPRHRDAREDRVSRASVACERRGRKRA